MAHFKDSNIAFVLKNVAIAVLVVVIAIVAVLIWLRKYTEHGIEVEVPSVTGLYITEATAVLQKDRLKLEVIDSTYNNKMPLGTIVEQTPKPYNRCKHGRTVYVTVNASARRQIPLPDLHDISYRQAAATLHSLGLTVEEVLYEPSEYKDIVLDVQQNGEPLAAGARVEEGSAVTLIIGFGKGTEKVSIPELRGKTLYEARAILLANYLTVGAIGYDSEVTEDNRDSFVVYMQKPFVGEQLLEGSRVDLDLTTDMEKALFSTQSEENDEESFF
mgnify:CR=1 FL=1